MRDQIVIRQIRPEELDDLLKLYVHLHRKDAPLPERDVLDAVWASILTNPFLHCIVGELEGQMVSSCILAIVPNLTRGARPYGLIENVVTHADYRKQGYGTAVLRYALRLAWDMKCYKVMLLTGSKEDSTLMFYEGVGFQKGIKTGFVAYPPSER